jgi:4-amino-4-deoxy-L-arabinose transferase-like glycosyltransferase
MLLKTVALPIVVLELLFIAFIRCGKDRIKESLKDFATFVFPMLICAAITCAYFKIRGGFDDFYYWNVVFPSSYKASGVSGPQLFNVLTYLTPTLVFPTVLALFSIPWFWSKKRTVTGVFTLMLIPAVWCVVALPGKYFPHYFINIIPLLSILAGIALAHFTIIKKPAAILVSLIAIIIFSFSIKENYRFYTTYTPETVSMIKYGAIFVNAVPVANYLKERTQPNDYIFQWGLEPELYFLADRRSPVPYITSVAVGWSKDPEKAKRTLVESLLTKRPKYIVFQNEWSLWPGLEEVQAIINSQYVFDQLVPFGHIVRRKDLPFL